MGNSMSSTRLWFLFRTRAQSNAACHAKFQYLRSRSFVTNQSLMLASKPTSPPCFKSFVAMCGAAVGFGMCGEIRSNVSAFHLRHENECDDLEDLSKKFQRSANWRIQNMGVVIKTLLDQYQDGHSTKFEGSCSTFLDSICEYLLTTTEKHGHTLNRNIAALEEKGYPGRLTDQMYRVQELAKEDSSLEKQQ